MMSTDYSPCPVCGLEEAHAVMENAQLALINCQRCGAVTSYEPDDEECREFDPDDYDWVGDQAPEEPGLYLVERGHDIYTVAFYYADESGDSWTAVNDDGSPGNELTDVNGWAELPAGCVELPQYCTGKKPADYRKPQVYQWGPAWFWSIPYEIHKEGNTPAVCGPFESKKEAADDLKAKLAEIKEMA